MTDQPDHPPLLEIRNLKLDLKSGHGWFRVIDDVSLRIHKNETVGLVGESGSGKSISALSIARLVPSPPARYAGGQILLHGHDVLQMTPAQLRAVRGKKVAYIFQEPGASLNPVFRIGSQILETLRLHQPRTATRLEVIRLLSQVGIPAPQTRIDDYPHQLSGGMQQRVMIAMAIASKPELLVADEPTTALDVTIQAGILELLQQLKETHGMSMLLITHNLALLRDIADRVIVMYCGQIVEDGPTNRILHHPRHPYTRALLQSIPQLNARSSRLKAIGGIVPTPGNHPAGCRFHPRCPIAREDCRHHPPELAGTDQFGNLRCPHWQTPS